MRRIKTFAIFESELPNIGGILDQLNLKTQQIGYIFEKNIDGIWSTSEGYTLALEGEKPCGLRELILSIFFDANNGPEGMRYRIIQNDKPGTQAMGQVAITYDLNVKQLRIANRVVIGLDPDAPDSVNIDKVVNEIIRRLSELDSMECMLVPPVSGTFQTFKTGDIIKSEFGDAIPSFIPGLAAEALGDRNAPRLIANAMNNPEIIMISKLVKLFKDNEPDLWARVKPLLGAGGGEIEELSDLGF